MTIDDKIRDGKLQFDNNRTTAKICAVSSGKRDKNEYLTDEEILLLQQSRIYKRLNFLIHPSIFWI